jgi:hypothetical protein
VNETPPSMTSYVTSSTVTQRDSTSSRTGHRGVWRGQIYRVELNALAQVNDIGGFLPDHLEHRGSPQ